MVSPDKREPLGSSGITSGNEFGIVENGMKIFTGFVVLAVGITLVVWGVNSSQSVSSEISRFFTGAVTNKAIYLILGGAVAVIAGASIAFTRRGKRA
jgi:hypothetical protein